jgi:hypothetical protein
MMTPPQNSPGPLSGGLVNVIDKPAFCGSFGSIVNAYPGDGISTDGAAPVFARRSRSSKPVAAGFSRAAAARVGKQPGLPFAGRQVLAAVHRTHHASATDAIPRRIQSFLPKSKVWAVHQNGSVTLVGAGPATWRCLRCALHRPTSFCSTFGLAMCWISRGREARKILSDNRTTSVR